MGEDNKELIEKLIKFGYLKTAIIIDAFKNIKREDFVLQEHKDIAYINSPLSIGYGQTISQPLVVAFMLELLDIRPGNKILEIGTGSGWQTTLIAHILCYGYGTDKKKCDGKIITMEIIKELSDFAKNNISKYEFIDKDVIKIVAENGYYGYEKDASYDRIISTASSDLVPKKWKEQLKIGGKMVLPVKNSINILTKTNNKKFEIKTFYGFSFVSLIK